MYWVNGELQQTVAIGDRSFQYGDGCFTTMLVLKGTVQHWSFHQQRLQNCLSAIGIQEPDWLNVTQWVNKAILSMDNPAKGGIKIHISRGVGGRGYSSAGFGAPNVTISIFAFPDHYADWQQHGIELGICRKKLGLNPLLAGHKHNNRLEQIILKAELEERGLADGIALDLNNHVTETTMANLFWVKNGVLHTPSLDQAGVAGVMRRYVIEQARANGTTVEIHSYKLEELLDADEVFITNSILEIAPVKKIEDKIFSTGTMTEYFKKRVLSV